MPAEIMATGRSKVPDCQTVNIATWRIKSASMQHFALMLCFLLSSLTTALIHINTLGSETDLMYFIYPLNSTEESGFDT
jgi:hypothetical protein